MKKIILFLLMFSVLNAVEKIDLSALDEDIEKKKIEPYSRWSKEYKELMKAPFKTDLIIGYLNSNKKNVKILRYLYKMTNNEIIREKIIEQLEKKSPYTSNKEDVLFSLLDQGKLNELLREFSDKKMSLVSSKALKYKVYAIKGVILKEDDKYLYERYYERGILYAGKKKNTFFYLLYKAYFKIENYIYAYKYLEYIHDIDYYKYIEEDLFRAAFLGAQKYYKEGNNLMAWMMYIEAMKYVKKISYNRNIDDIIKTKEMVFKTSQALLMDNNKIKDKSLYIIQTTKKYLVGDK